MKLTEQMTYRLSPADKITLEKLAKDEKLSIGKLLRKITNNYANNENR
jgi:predicted DNA-binding ribbon-helix-helix protein